MITIVKKPKSVLEPQPIVLRSFSDPSKWYNVDRINGTCDCGSFANEGYCKHLEQVGYYKQKSWKQSPFPTVSQALSGLVKSIRIRHIEDAIYWLVYLDRKSVTDKGTRFRVARRILIGSAEDGVSIPIMEKVASNFPHLCQEETHLISLAAEVVRICKAPNWWHDSTNGPEYIHECMVAYRRHEVYGETRQLTLGDKLKGLEESLAEGDNHTAMVFFDSLMGHQGFTRAGLCSELMMIANKDKNEQALRVLNVHNTFRTPLSHDANFLGQAVWWLMGEGFHTGEEIHTVMSSEVRDYINRATERWLNPEPIPAWCCDGIHCGGTDRRYAGMVTDMDALCNSFKEFGRVDPEDVWPISLYPLDGLVTK